MFQMYSSIMHLTSKQVTRPHPKSRGRKTHSKAMAKMQMQGTGEELDPTIQSINATATYIWHVIR